jgi:phage shock protein A
VLLEQEQELEELRALLRPQYWPRLYEMLKRVREQIRELESSISSNPSDSDVA